MIFGVQHESQRQYRSLALYGLVVFFSAVVFWGTGSLVSGIQPVPKHEYAPAPIASIVDQGKNFLPLIAPQDLADSCVKPANPIVAENCQPGSEDWIIRKNSFEIQGYPSATSINLGERIQFYIDTTSPRFSAQIYRLGYYSGKGGRQIFAFPHLSGKRQPECLFDSSTGLSSCSNWSPSFDLVIPDDWISGAYIVKLIQEDTQGENYIPFVVRNDADQADILYQQSVIAYQAYNNYGGKSLYFENSNACLTVAKTPQAVKVSFDRPYIAPMGDPSTFFRAEYPMVRWLEAQGYWITYSTDLDTHHSGESGSNNRLLDHKAFITVGHDEYWSAEMRRAVEEARDHGVSLGFFAANSSYWQIRFEPDPWSAKAERTIVSYKTIESGIPDPGGISTSTWRDPRGANQPENGLLGVQFVGDNELNFLPPAGDFRGCFGSSFAEYRFGEYAVRLLCRPR